MSIFNWAGDGDRQLLQARMDLLARTLPGTFPFMLVLTAVVGALLWRFVTPPLIVGWMLYMLVLTAARYLHVRRYARSEPDTDAAQRFHNWFVVGVVYSGIGWGAAGAALFPPDNIVYQSFLSFVLAGITAASVTAYAPILFAERLFLGLALIPLAIVHFLLADQVHVAMGMLVLCYTALLFRIATVAHESVISSLRLRFENDALIGELTQAKKTAELINQKLEAEIGTRNDTATKLIEARDKAEKAARAKSDFLATMSHEIRTPMNGVLGMTELLMNTDLSSKQRRFAATIRRSGEALLAIINDILDFSKIEAGKLDLQHTVFDLRQLVEDTVAFFAEQAHRKKIELLTVYPPADHAAYRGDPDRIRQVLMNLIGNAIKFTDSGEISIKLKTLDEALDKNVVRFEVTDSGIGIKPEHQQHIFQSFQQADGSTSRKFGGTGLGLAICKRLIELMHGSIGVDSNPGAGSTFWFSIALTKMPASSISGQIKHAVDLAGRRVLVVDDNETNRDILKHQLENWNMKYYAVPSGEHALKYLRKGKAIGKPFDLAVLDRHLPDIEGIDLARRIKKDPAIADTRLVMLSSIDQLEQTGQWYLAGIEVYINKPVRQVELYDALTSALGRGASGDPAAPQPAPPASQAQSYSLGAHVLLAEDNPVNQELARAMLEGLGCTVVLAENGEQAVAAITEAPLDRLQRHYDLVLMDCQMPLVDGYEATRSIRAWEKRNRDKSGILPIIALTANALQGDRERCLAAGMNDYLSKPFTQEQLAGIVSRWMTLDVEIGQRAGRKPASPATAVASEGAIYDGTATLDQKALSTIRALEKDDGVSILAKIIGMYLNNSPKLLEKLQEAATTGNGALLRASAHSLKSASANLGAIRLAELCNELERLGRDGDASAAVATLGIVEFEFEAVCNALTRELGRKAA